MFGGKNNVLGAFFQGNTLQVGQFHHCFTQGHFFGNGEDHGTFLDGTGNLHGLNGNGGKIPVQPDDHLIAENTHGNVQKATGKQFAGFGGDFPHRIAVHQHGSGQHRRALGLFHQNGINIDGLAKLHGKIHALIMDHLPFPGITGFTCAGHFHRCASFVGFDDRVQACFGSQQRTNVHSNVLQICILGVRSHCTSPHQVCQDKPGKNNLFSDRRNSPLTANAGYIFLCCYQNVQILVTYHK